MKKIDQAAWDAEWVVASERPADGKKMPVEKDANGNDVYRTYLRDEYQEAIYKIAHQWASECELTPHPVQALDLSYAILYDRLAKTITPSMKADALLLMKKHWVHGKEL